MQVPSPATTFSYTENFKNNTTALFTTPLAGTISSNKLTLTAGLAPTVQLVDLGAYLGMAPGTFALQPGSLLDLKATLTTGGRAGLIYDYYGAGNFKFAVLRADTGLVVLGHYTTQGGWVVDESASYAVTAGASYTLEVNAKGLTVSMLVNGAPVLSHVYNALVTDGKFGLLAGSGTVTFSQAFLRTDDTQFVAGTAVQHMNAATASSGPALGVTALTTDELNAILGAAIDRLSAALVLGATSIAELEAATIQIASLPGLDLGITVGDRITISPNAAGWGWYVDPTPNSDSEFAISTATGRAATPNSPAYGEMDLLTVLMHELAHVVGYGDTTSGLMSEELTTGTRLAPPVAGDRPAASNASVTRAAEAASTGTNAGSDATDVIANLAQSLSQTLTFGGIADPASGFIPPSAINRPAAPRATRIFDEASGALIGQDEVALWTWLQDGPSGPTRDASHSDWLVRGLGDTGEVAGGKPTPGPENTASPLGVGTLAVSPSDQDGAANGNPDGLSIDWNATFSGLKSRLNSGVLANP